jgi:DNA-binding transcriptional LysR family regulator
MDIPPDSHIQKFYAFTWQSSASHPAIYARIGHPLAGKNTLADIADADWGVAGLAGTPGNVIEEAFRVRRWSLPRVSVQCSDYAMLVRIVSCSDLLCVISHPALVPEPERLTLRQIEILEGLPHYDVCLFWSDNASQANGGRNALVNVVRTALRDVAPEFRTAG